MIFFLPPRRFGDFDSLEACCFAFTLKVSGFTEVDHGGIFEYRFVLALLLLFSLSFSSSDDPARGGGGGGGGFGLLFLLDGLYATARTFLSTKLSKLVALIR